MWSRPIAHMAPEKELGHYAACSVINCEHIPVCWIISVFPERSRSHTILKKPNLDCNNLKNFRPVSNTAFLSKIIEKAALCSVNNHVCSNNLTQMYQSAYRSGHSTETALLRVKSNIMSALDNRRAVFLVLLDLSAAFDTIDHGVFLSRLSNIFGISGSVCKWFESYLCNRSNRVKVAGALSDPQTLNFGLPQGSVIGPQSFSFYTHPVANIIKCYKNVMFHFYADDTQLYISFDPRNQCEVNDALSSLSNCILSIMKWMANNMLQLNETKTEFFIAASPCFMDLLSSVTLKVGSEVIPPAKTTRNLGVVFDQSMRMSIQVSSVSSAVNVHLRNLSRIRSFLTQSACQNAIRAIVTSRLDYANSLLAGLSSKDTQRLQRLQNCAAKLIFQAKK